MIWHLIRIIFSFGFDTFYKRTAIKNRHHVIQKGPVILAFNHPNAFMDPVMFSYMAYPPKFYFLARGDVFNSGFAIYFLEGLGIAPIFRIQDGGKEGLKKNDETYRRVFKMLRENKKVIIFAEGLCVLERRLRPLKKGVPRMVFNAMEEINDPRLIVVPVGVNYTDAKKFRSHLFFNIGEPIKVADFMEDYRAQPARTMNAFLKVLEPKMKELIVHINDPRNDELVKRLEEMLTRDWSRQQGLNYKNLEHELKISQQITAVVNKADEENKEIIDLLNEKSKDYFEKLKRVKMRDWLINPSNRSKLNWFNFLLRSIPLLVLAPLWIRGVLGNYLPWKISEAIVKKKIRNVEFYASFNLAFGTLLTWIYYFIQFMIVYYFTHNVGWPFLVMLVSFITGKFILYYYPFLLKTAGLFRALTHFENVKELKLKRQEIIDLIAQINKN